MKITVITVCYNAKDAIKKTIESVINQDYKNLEYIIVDGASTDGTKEIIEEYQKIFPIILVSEPDKGIYNAMNKGTRLASGDWLNFMNAGDTFYRQDSISQAAKFLSAEDDIVYGDTEIIYHDFKTIKKEPNPNKLWMGRIPHQSAFIKSPTMKKYGYNGNNKIVADLEFFMNVYFNNGKIKKTNQVVSSFAKDGITEKMDKQVIIDAHQTVKKFKNDLSTNLYYFILKIKPLLKKILPRKIFKFIKTKTKF